MLLDSLIKYTLFIKSIKFYIAILSLFSNLLQNSQEFHKDFEISLSEK